MTVYCLSKPLFFFKGLFVFLAFGILFQSCKNGEGIGFELQDASEGINSIRTDTISLRTSTVREDSLRTENLSYNPLGSMNDPIFGKTAANFFTEPRLQSEGTGFSYGVNPVFDSVVLSFRYAGPTGYYGTLGSEQQIKVYQLTQRIHKNQDYYSNSPVSYDPIEIGNWTGKFNLTDSVGNPKEAPQLRIKLTAAFFDKLTQANQDNNESFISAINGIAVICPVAAHAPGEGAIVYLNTRVPSACRITVYYNQGSSHFYPIDDGSVRISNFTHDYTGSTVANYINSGRNSDTAFVQTLAGIKMKIELPHLFNLVAKDPVAINSAEIVFTALDGTYDASYSLPSRLLLIQPDEQGKNTFILDLQPSEANLYGGNLEPSTGRYRFRITRHLQDLLNVYRKTGVDKNRGLYLIVPTDFPLTAGRVVIDSRKQPQQVKLVLTYTIAK